MVTSPIFGTAMLRRLSIVLSILFGLQAQVQADTTTFRHFNIDSGLPSNNIYSIIQDHLGYIWFATDNGVVKYNGYTFRVFNTATGLPSNDVWRLEEDSIGRMWVFSSTHSFGYIKDDEYRPIALTEGNRVFYPFYFTKLKESVCFLVVQRTTAFYTVVDKYDRIHSINLSPVLEDIVLNEHGDLWDFDNDTLNFIRIASGPVSATTHCVLPLNDYFEAIRASVILPFDSIIYSYAFKSRFIYILNTLDCTIKTVDLTKIELQDDEFTYLFAQQGRKLTLITNKDIYNVERTTISGTDPIARQLMKRAQVTYRQYDDAGGTWYASNTDGAVRMLNNTFPKGKPFSLLDHFQPTGWAPDGYSYWWDRKTSQLLELKGLNKTASAKLPHMGALNNVQRSMLPGAGLNLAFTSGIYLLNSLTAERPRKLLQQFSERKVYNTSTGQFHYLHRADTFNYNYINTFAAHQYRPDVLYAISFVGLLKYMVKSDTLEIVPVHEDRFTGLTFDSVNQLYWAYNSERILIVSPSTGRSYSAGNTTLRQLGINNVKTVKPDGHGGVFILSDDWLTHFDLKNLRHRIYFSRYNLNNTSMTMNDSVVLVAGRFGVGMLQYENGRYTESIWPNAQEHAYKYISTLHIQDSILIMTTDRGCRIYPLQSVINYIRNANRPSVRFIAEGRIIRPGDTVNVSPGANKITIDLINLAGSGSLQYKYRLNQNDNWQVSTSGELSLDGLDPEQTYQMECQIRDNIFEGVGIKFYVYQVPRWYETLTSQIIFISSGLGFFMLCLFAVSLLTKQLVAKTSEKKRLQTELELRALHSQINPHFIFNTLSTALFFISKQQTSEAYDHVSRFSKLLRSYLKSSRERWVTLSDEIEMLSQYVDLERKRLKQGVDFEVIVDRSLLPTHILIPALLLQPLVENAIHHGLFNKLEKGWLRLNFRQGEKPNQLICTIEDNGIGRAKAKALKELRKEKSYGNTLTSELIDVFKKYEQLDIKLEYIDKQAPETGTIVKLVISNVKTAPSIRH